MFARLAESCAQSHAYPNNPPASDISRQVLSRYNQRLRDEDSRLFVTEKPYLRIREENMGKSGKCIPRDSAALLPQDIVSYTSEAFVSRP